MSVPALGMIVAALTVVQLSERGFAASGYRLLLPSFTLVGFVSVVLAVIALVRGERSRWLLMPALVGGLPVLAVLFDVAMQLIFGPS